MRERLKNLPAPEFVKYILKPLLEKDAKQSFKYFNNINKAHLLMLLKQGILDKNTVSKIAKALLEVDKRGPQNIDLDPAREDLSSCIEAAIMEICTQETGGRLHTGRSRNDLGGTVTRMFMRDKYLKTCKQVLELREFILDFAAPYTETVCTGYTCGQAAEPITVAYYFAAHLSALERDYERFSAIYKRLNQCPLGSCAMASTTFPINRAITAHYLGFDAATINSLDGIAARDYILEILGTLSIFMNNLSRLCQDLYVWSSVEFGLVDIDSSVSMCSSIMPQKKNPVTLEHIKAKAAHVEGDFVSALSALKSTIYTQVRDSSIEAAHSMNDALYEVEASIKLLIATLETMVINKERMLHEAKTNFCTVSELANTLVRDCGLSFRYAHSTVAGLVAYMLDNELKPNDINSAMVKKLAYEIIGKDISITDEHIRHALDPIPNVFARDVEGGPAPTQVIKQMSMMRKKLEKDKRELTNRVNMQKRAEEELNKDIQDICR